MYSKLICATLITVASGHSLVARDTSSYGKVNRDSGAASSSSYGAPAQSYGAPAPSYSAPAAPSYSAPAPSYSAPAPSYSAPESSYSAPASGYGEETGGGLDLTSILIPLLALIGLSLLFPTFVSVSATGRKRRSAEIGEETSPMTEVFERVNDIYMSVVQSEECMERIACEVGGLANEFGMDSYARMAKPFVGGKYKNYLKQFTSGQNCHKIKCGSFN